MPAMPNTEGETMPLERTFHFQVRAVRDGTPVEYPKLPVYGTDVETARRFLDRVLDESGYQDVEVTPLPTPDADRRRPPPTDHLPRAD